MCPILGCVKIDSRPSLRSRHHCRHFHSFVNIRWHGVRGNNLAIHEKPDFLNWPICVKTKDGDTIDFRDKRGGSVLARLNGSIGVASSNSNQKKRQHCCHAED